MRRDQKIINQYKKCKSLNEVELEFVKEWHPEYNDGKNPQDFKPQSNKKVWWKCKKNHEWTTTIQRRLYGDNCPYCSGKKPTVDNCLRTRNPVLSKEWNYYRNEVYNPRNVLPGSTKKVWWICVNGHEWEARIDHRNNVSGCPVCRRRMKIKERVNEY